GSGATEADAAQCRGTCSLEEYGMLQLRVVFLLVALLLAGCAGLGTQRDSIRVTVSDIRVIEATLLEQVYQVTLRVQNRVADAIDIRGGSFDLAINGRDFGSGVTDQSVTVPGYADAKIEVRMVSTVFGMLRMVESLQSREGRTLDYAISGSFSTGSGFGGVRFHEAGEVTLPSGQRNPAEDPVPAL
ncbi:MAG: LEA type 2 family protein, partial [Chromatiales bacterium]|nr:LEA type 2 family protein [Chromatiales bacterium]